LLNRLLSLRQDVYWRRKMISALELKPTDAVLDVACGTGDVIREICVRGMIPRQVIGVDFAPRMLNLAKAKMKKQNTAQSLGLVAGNGLRLPFRTQSFDAVTIAFGIRNIMDRRSALTGFYDCLKPGGRLAVLELATPQNRLLLSAYLFYFTRILPQIGAVFSRHGRAYTYLPASVIHFPPPEGFARLMRQVGFKGIKWRRLTLGVATLHIGCKEIEGNP
jgi:demethylmenaquinone methyltransferase / 2-methoxy-6-polyprenyl-1,4-benzoquinol methylase